MKRLSPLAQKYKDAFDGYMFVFDIDGASERRLVMRRHSLVVLDGHSSCPSRKAIQDGIYGFVRLGGNSVKCRRGEAFDFFPDVREILLALHEAEIPIALASSTWAPELFRLSTDFTV